jgi:hypothetical protein
MKSNIVFGLIGVGFLLFALSALWSTLFPASARWTPEKAKRSAEVKVKLHNMSFIVNAPTTSMHSGPDLGKLRAEYEELRKENDQLNADFTSAAETPQTISKFLKWTGLSLAIVGLIGYYAVSQSR